MDVLASFFEDRCTIQRTASATAEALYEAYKEWCTTNGERFETSQSFGRRLKERKLKQGKERGQRCWFGIGLITEGVQSSLEIDDSSTADPFHKG